MKKRDVLLIILMSAIGMGALSSQSIMRMSYRLTDIAYNPVDDKIYGAFSGLFKGGNAIVVINPNTGIIEDTIPVRSDPNVIKFSSNYEYLYITFRDWYGLARLHVPSKTVEEVARFSHSNTIPAGDVYKHEKFVNEILPIPGQPDDVIVCLGLDGQPEEGPSFVMKNGIVLPDSVKFSVEQSRNLAMHAPTSTFYGFGHEGRASGLLKYTLQPSGIVYNSIDHSVSGEYMELEIVRDRLYCQEGQVFDVSGASAIPIGNLYTGTGRTYHRGVMEYDTLSDLIYLYDWVQTPYGYFLYTIDPDDLSMISKVNLWSTSAMHPKKMILAGQPGRLAMIASPTYNTNLEVWTANLFLINNCGASTPENISITNSAGNSICKGDTITLSASGQHDQFIWSNGLTGAQITIPLSVTTTVSVQGYDIEGCHTGASGSLVITVVEPAALTGSDILYTICRGDSITLNATTNNATNFLWSTDGQTQSITVSDTGYYTVIGFRGPGCTNGIPKGRLVHWYTNEDIPKPVIDPAGPIQMCPGESVQLTTQPGNLFVEWKHNTNPNAQITVSNAGSYQVRLADGFGCFGPYSDPVSVSFYAPPSIPILRTKDSLVYIINNTIDVEWFFNGQQIPRPANDSLVAIDYGFYAIRTVSPEGCYSKMGGPVYMNKPALPDPGIMQFYVFVDYNMNDILDDDEFILANQPVFIQSLYFTTFTGLQGVGSLNLSSGLYDLWARVDTSVWDLKLGKDGIHLNLTSAGAVAIFSVVPKTAEEDLELNITTERLRCSETPYVKLNAVNTSGYIISGKICIVIDDLIVAVKDSGEYIFPKPDTLCWIIDSLYPSIAWNHKFYVEIPGFQHAGDSLHFKTFFDSDEGSHWELNMTDVIRCSYDPNDKAVSPALGDMGQYALLNEPLLYTIRFQNTGNDTAFQVTLVDHLSDDLDWETFKPVDASHEYRIMLDMLTGKLTVLFDNIMLPDSNINLLGSEGFFVFQIMPRSGLVENTLITNTADIIFDLNPAVITNTVETELVTMLPTSIWNEDYNEIEVLLYPNPYNEFFMLDVKGITGSIIFEVYDALGRKWFTTLLSPEAIPIKIEPKGWPDGIFHYRLKDQKTLQLIEGGLMIKE